MSVFKALLFALFCVPAASFAQADPGGWQKTATKGEAPVEEKEEVESDWFCPNPILIDARVDFGEDYSEADETAAQCIESWEIDCDEHRDAASEGAQATCDQYCATARTLKCEGRLNDYDLGVQCFVWFFGDEDDDLTGWLPSCIGYIPCSCHR